MGLLDAFKQYVRDAMPGGALNPEVTKQGLLDTAAVATTPVPVLGDLLGLAADVKRLKDNPQERTPMNIGLSALGVLPFVPSLAGMFVGKGSKTWDALSAAKAQEMASKGVDPRQIWKETGTFKGPDGHWRQEISDHNIRPLERTWGEGADLKAGERTTTVRQRALAHPQLSAAYPDTKQIGVMMKPGESKSASYISDPDGGLFDDTISLSVSPKYNYKADPSTMLHELQHAIQQREGWARGGMPEMFSHLSPETVNDAQLLQARISKGESPTQAAAWMKQNLGRNPDIYAMDIATSGKAFTSPKTPEEAYRRLAGEAEARATQARMNLNAAQRRELFPLDSYDVPVDQLIIRGLLD